MGTQGGEVLHPRLLGGTGGPWPLYSSSSTHTLAAPFLWFWGDPGPSPNLPQTLTVFKLVHALSQRPEVGVAQGCLCCHATLGFVLKGIGWAMGPWLGDSGDPSAQCNSYTELDGQNERGLSLTQGPPGSAASFHLQASPRQSPGSAPRSPATKTKPKMGLPESDLLLGWRYRG